MRQKISVPDEIAQEVLRLHTEANWSYPQIAEWLNKSHGYRVSREWVRLLLVNMKGGGGPPPAETRLEDMDEDQQLHRIQIMAFREAITKSRRGDTYSFAAAAKAHMQAIEARRKIRDQQEPVALPSPSAPPLTQTDRDALVRSLRGGGN